MEKKIIEIGNKTKGFLDYTKAIRDKRSGDSSIIPNIVVRKSEFNFSKSKIDYFTDLVGFKKDSTLVPSLYIHLLGFNLQSFLILHKDFPFPAMGMVHISNKVIQHRPFTLNEIDKVEAYFENPKKHNRGVVFTVVSKVFDKNGVVIGENHAEQLKIIGKGESSGIKKQFEALTGKSFNWEFESNIGRRFSTISGDINPIHLFPITAKLFGFKRHIAHGMYSCSRALATIDKELSNVNSYEYYTEFKQPIFLPGNGVFTISKKSDQELTFELVNAEKNKPHVNGYFKFN